MRVFCLRAPRVKLPLNLFLAFAALLGLALLLPPEQSAQTGKLSVSDMGDNTARVALLESLGITVQSTPQQVVQVLIPREFDAVFSAYNDLQKPLGLDLSRHRGKEALRYTYVVENCSYDGTVYANLLVRADKLIGADLCSARADGFLQALTDPLPGAPPTPPAADSAD